MSIIRLTKRNQDLALLSFVNFKIETTDRIANIINNDAFWPDSVVISAWKPKQNGICNFQANSNHHNSNDSTEQNFRLTQTVTNTTRHM